MSDFLTRLAQRQLGQITTIEPRLPAMHAPLAAEAAFPDAGLGADNHSSSAMETGDSSGRPSSNPGAGGNTRLSLADRSNAEAPLRHRRWPGENKPEVDAPILNEAESARAEVPRIETPLRAAVSPRAGATIALEHRSIESPVEGPSVPHGIVAEEYTASPAGYPFPAPRLLVERKSAEKISAPLSMHGLMEPAGIAPRANSRQAGTWSQERPATDAGEPPVQVSIGRIEVTTVTAAMPAKPMAPARKQGLTLDAYLARRQRGER
jgi:hypothetical protein